MSGGDPYVFPGTQTLRNKLDIRDAALLDRAERRIATQRVREGVPKGDFDLAHLQAIHKHLFQDVYEWAGQVRTVDIAKDTEQFLACSRIETGMADVKSRLEKKGHLQFLRRAEFAKEAAVILGDVNFVHPFREGNGRTQMQYLKQLAEHAGHNLDLTLIPESAWIAASRDAHHANYEPMARCIDAAITPMRSSDLSHEKGDAGRER
ncbi:Fic family protein [Rhizobium sp. T1470]|uniref:Fic/DOC family protein n=1 Tax=unclassified Rhizobium TaxID=2613769 RepID=UPI001AAE62A2|nr:Fic family protein [Rhizobium sp. T1473]MCA0800437.1 Fic family protein [Rhizobium sp. T1473]